MHSDLRVQVSSSPMVRLTWDKIDCDGYKVYRGSKAIARVEAGPGDDLVTYTDEEIEPGASYTYLVRAFNACERLRDITLPKSVTTIEKRAFFGCASLSSVSGKGSVTGIGEYAFEGTGGSSISSLLDPNVTIGFGVFAANEIDD